MLNEWHCDNFFMVISVDKVDMVGKPTHSKYDDHNNKHFNNLKSKIFFSSYTPLTSFMKIKFVVSGKECPNSSIQLVFDNCPSSVYHYLIYVYSFIWSPNGICNLVCKAIHMYVCIRKSNFLNKSCIPCTYNR